MASPTSGLPDPLSNGYVRTWEYLQACNAEADTRTGGCRHS